MKGIRFIFCIHNHQPVGNFDHVIEDAYQRAYRPFLDVMERFPQIPWVLHNSGCLWEWLETHHGDYVDRIGRQVAEGRLELLGGGFYEPILPALTAADRRGQIERMHRYLEQRFGARPRGIWLTERVWEPDLPIDLAAAGIAYLPLDDTQLHQVGVAPGRVRGSFVTESGGALLRLFPALMELRYRIPYAPVEEVLGFLKEPFPGGGSGLAVYADDGEKLGIWPGSHRLLYEERWLERLLEGLQAAGQRIQVTSFAREADTPVEGSVYLPAGSYAEMGQWSLPPQEQAGYVRARAALEAAGLEREARLFVRGGFWRNFFARYPESSWMHMRALRATEAARRLGGALRGEEGHAAWDHLWRAQCNCAYWHGVFGGLYLPHLRDGLYRELIRGERILAQAAHGPGAWVGTATEDLDLDGEAELIVENDALRLFLDPHRGGRLLEWDDREGAINLVNVLARRREYYHERVEHEAQVAAERAAEESGGPAKTIHGPVRSREQGLQALLTYDDDLRAGLVDRFFTAVPSAAELREGTAAQLGDWARAPYTLETEGAEGCARVSLRRAGSLGEGERAAQLEVTKTLTLEAGQRGFRVAWHYRHVTGSAVSLWAGIESHFNLLAGRAPDRWVAIDGKPSPRPELAAEEAVEQVASLALVEGWRGWHLAITPSRPLALRRYPVETVSLSESGVERNYQGSALVFLLPLELGAGEEARLELHFAVVAGEPPAGDAR